MKSAPATTPPVVAVQSAPPAIPQRERAARIPPPIASHFAAILERVKPA